MNRKALESLDKEALIDLVLTLAARVAELEAKLGLPPKTPNNGADPILKERLFGLSNAQGNHGEDVKELYYYLDATPTYAYARMRISTRMRPILTRG